jgi:hypothetical protein
MFMLKLILLVNAISTGAPLEGMRTVLLFPTVEACLRAVPVETAKLFDKVPRMLEKYNMGLQATVVGGCKRPALQQSIIIQMKPPDTTGG